VSPSQAVQQQEGQAIKSLYTTLLLCSIAVIGWNCSSSEQIPNEQGRSTGTDPKVNRDTAVHESAPQRVAPTSQQFKVHADTVTAQPRKKGSKQKTSIEIRPVPPKKYYAIQIGAFKHESNIDNNKKILSKRFNQPVTVFFDPGIKLTRICMGNFLSKEDALTFLKKMREQYPNEYKSAWVAELSK